MALVTLKLLIELPEPEAAKPMDVLLFVHVKFVLGRLLVKLSNPVGSPLQSTRFAGTVATGETVTLMDLVTVVVPHSFVTASCTV